jgi:hypothetical protein
MSNGQKSSQVSGCVNGVLADPRAYFFSLVGSTEGSPAPDWKAKLESLPGRGMGVNPKPGERQPLNAPHYGITVMIDAGGNARGRIWLPTDVPVMADGNAWFTHEIQVIADGPTPGSMVWAWIDKGGAQYAPRPCEQGGTGTSTGTTTGSTAGTSGAAAQAGGDMVIDLRPLEARIQALERLVAAQAKDIADLKSRPAPSTGGGTLAKKIALKTDHGTYVTAEPDGKMTNREDHPASWQTFKVESMG